MDLLQYAIRRWRDSAAKVLLLVSLRSDALHPMTQPQVGGLGGLSQWLRRVSRELAPVHIELEPLGEQETLHMVLSILAPPAADFAQWLYDETRGQPFYLMETLKDLLERRVLRPKKNNLEGNGPLQWTLSTTLGKRFAFHRLCMPWSRSRLNRLGPNAFNLLAGGAVLEQQITFGRLCAVSNVDEDMALPALDELISGRLLLEAAQPDVVSTYVFANDMLRDVVYTEAGDARRRLFHRRALEILEGAGASAAVLAHHALAAGLAQAAFHYSLAAGARSAAHFGGE